MAAEILARRTARKARHCTLRSYDEHVEECADDCDKECRRRIGQGEAYVLIKVPPANPRGQVLRTADSWQMYAVCAGCATYHGMEPS